MRTRPLLFALSILALGLTGCPDDTPECTGDDCAVACDPACSGARSVCDPETKTCVVCTASAGCRGEEVCDTSASGGECVECLTDTHCSGDRPICDLLTNTCSVCTSFYGCGAGQVCDTSVSGGQCVDSGCSSSSQCSASTPVCDVGSGRCIVCTATAGCGAGQTCDTSVHGGRCVTGCVSSATCSAPNAVCDTEAHKCVVCTEGEGCASGQECDTAVSGGQCVQAGCTSSAQCSSPTPVCDVPNRQCVVCTDNEGCSSNQTCDDSVVGGRCVGTGCTSSAQCSGQTPVCELGTGRCIVCTEEEGCPSGETCDTAVSGGRCEDLGCASGTEPCQAPTSVCDTVSGDCVVCTPTAGCSAGQSCDTQVAGGQCVTSGCTSNTGCPSASPVCDTSTHECIVCNLSSGCSGTTPRCNTAVAGGQCVQCLSDGDCSGTTPWCSPAKVCQATPSTASAQIAAARSATGATLSLPIGGAIVTYLKPVTGSEKAGFFIQAEQAGPALFIAVDPGLLSPSPAVGDKVNLTVTSMGVDMNATGTVTYGTKQALAITDFGKVSSGNSVSALVQDVSSATDLVTNLNAYESELVRLTGSIAGDFGNGGSGHVVAQLATAGVPGSTSLKLRVPAAIQTALGLASGCTLTLSAGPMWRNNAIAEASGYSASDFTGVSCLAPAPSVVSATATSATTVRVDFDHDIGASSLLVNGSQFTFNNGLTASAASLNGRQVTVTTGTQQSGTSYTVTVARTIKDTSGTALGSTNTATFNGFASATGTHLVINEIDYDQPTSDSNEFVELYNPGSSAVTLDGLALVLVNGSSTVMAQYTSVALSGSVPAHGYVVVGSGTVTPAAGAVFFPFALEADNIQNGAPDGVALIDTNAGTVLDALSYEGSITACTITGISSPVSLVEGTALPSATGDSNTDEGSLIRSPNGQDTNDSATDWKLTTTPTPGAANVLTE